MMSPPVLLHVLPSTELRSTFISSFVSTFFPIARSPQQTMHLSVLMAPCIPCHAQTGKHQHHPNAARFSMPFHLHSAIEKPVIPQPCLRAPDGREEMATMMPKACSMLKRQSQAQKPLFHRKIQKSPSQTPPQPSTPSSMSQIARTAWTKSTSSSGTPSPPP